MSAMKDGEDIIPVKMLIKEYKNMDNVLYVTMTLDKIKEATGQRAQSTTVHSVTSNYSLAKLLSSVNDKSMQNYIPKKFYGQTEYANINKKASPPATQNNMSVKRVPNASTDIIDNYIEIVKKNSNYLNAVNRRVNRKVKRCQI